MSLYKNEMFGKLHNIEHIWVFKISMKKILFLQKKIGEKHLPEIVRKDLRECEYYCYRGLFHCRINERSAHFVSVNIKKLSSIKPRARCSLKLKHPLSHKYSGVNGKTVNLIIRLHQHIHM